MPADLAHVVEVVGDRGGVGDRARVVPLVRPLDPHALLAAVQRVQAVGAHVLVGGLASRRRPPAARTSARTWPSPPRRCPGSSASTSSGMLRGWSHTARAEECEKITGASLTRSASRMVDAATCERSTSMPSAVHLPHDLLAEAREAAVARLVGRRVRPVDVVVVGERHVAHAQPVQRAQRRQGVVDGVAALGAHQRGDTALGARRLHVVGGAGEPQVVRVAGGQLPYDVDLFQAGADRAVTGEVGCARTPTRTARRRRPPAAGGCRCADGRDWSAAMSRRSRS